jgi:hypothetical protein
VRFPHGIFLTATALLSVAAAGVAKNTPLVWSQRADTVVRRASAPVYPNGGTLVREISIGSETGPAEYQFTSIYAITIGRDSSVFIVNRGNVPGITGPSSVRQYTREGRYIRSFGRPGQGPGEWTEPVDVEELPDGRVLVLNPRSRRILVYSPDGTPLTYWTAAGSAGDLNPNRLSVDTAGYVYLSANITDTVTRKTTSVYVRYGGDGVAIDTLTLPEAPPLPSRTVSATGANNNTRSTPVPYMPGFTHTLCTTGYFVSGATATYNIDLLIPAAAAGRGGRWAPGMPVTSIRSTAPPVTVSAEERAELEKYIQLMLRTTDPRWTWNGPAIPRNKPVFSSIMCTLDGRIWVLRHVASERRPPPDSTRPAMAALNVTFFELAVYDVFETSGRLLGTVRIPAGAIQKAARGNDIWAVERDADGVESAVRYRINWR